VHSEDLEFRPARVGVLREASPAAGFGDRYIEMVTRI